MNTWPAVAAMISFAVAAGAAGWFTWQTRRITTTRYWINGEPASRAEFEAAAQREQGQP